MKLGLLLLVYTTLFFFSLGLWLEDCEGRRFLRPLLYSILWPFFLGVPVAFSLGCFVTIKMRAAHKA